MQAEGRTTLSQPAPIPEPSSAPFAQRFADPFSRYRVLRRVGAGSTGEVFQAGEQANDRLVALKLYRAPAEGLTAGAVKRFETEVAVLASLRHPGIVQVHDAGFWQGRPWLAMAWLEGHDLSHYTSAAERLPEAQVLMIGERIAEALAHAHRRGVVHRDVKPDNVRVHLPSSAVTLSDFGIARCGDGVQTDTGVVPGTPAFMAPELMAGALPDAASDLYALGVTLFQLLSARLPFEGVSMGELLRRVWHEDAPSLASIRPELPPGLVELVAGLLARRREQRPGDAAAVAETLRTLRAGP